MNRFTPGVPVVLVMSAWSLAALADDTQHRRTCHGHRCCQRQLPPLLRRGKAEQTAGSTTSSGNASMRRLVCLNMSPQCFAMKPKPEDSSAKSAARFARSESPDIRRIATPMQLHEQDEPDRHRRSAGSSPGHAARGVRAGRPRIAAAGSDAFDAGLAHFPARVRKPGEVASSVRGRALRRRNLPSRIR